MQSFGQALDYASILFRFQGDQRGYLDQGTFPGGIPIACGTYGPHAHRGRHRRASQRLCRHAEADGTLPVGLGRGSGARPHLRHPGRNRAMNDLTTLTIAQPSAMLARGEITPTTLIDAYLSRIERLDPKLAAFVTLTADAARASAEQADREIAGGHRRGPLHGIAIGIKDIYETAGVRTAGQSHLKINHVPTVDAETVARLRAAGAVIMGKLATHEFATGAATPDQPFPPSRNPWNLDLQPGGSSSGSGTAVAAGLCAGAMGSDTSGSIRHPAGSCAVPGHKPTYRLLHR